MPDTANAPICLICAKLRELENKSPIEMTVIGQTTNKQLDVYVCPTCDGSAIKYAQRF